MKCMWNTECINRPIARRLCTKHYQLAKKLNKLNEYPRMNRKNGTGSFGTNGYLFVRRENTNVGLHRIIMEKKLGRRLLPGESVHHLNGDRVDNRIENLELWTTAQPPGQRVEDKIVWAKSFLEQYGYECKRLA